MDREIDIDVLEQALPVFKGVIDRTFTYDCEAKEQFKTLYNAAYRYLMLRRE